METAAEQEGLFSFDEQPYRYKMYLSDVAGQDIEWHGNNPRNVVCRLRDWLASEAPYHLPSGGVVWDHYETFQGELRDQCAEHKQRPAELTYNDVLRHITTFRAAYVEKLDIQGSQTIRNPSADQIKAALKSLTSTDPDRFVVLIKGANGLTYAQAYMEKESLWTVEFQDGHLDRHFLASRKLSTEKVIQLFVSYLHGEESWRESVAWRPIEL